MFSGKLSRAAHRTATSSTAAASISCTAQCQAASRAVQHQRRPSSSKAQSPPDSSKPAPAAKATATATTTTTSERPASEPAPELQKRAGRNYKRGAHPARADRTPKRKEGPIDQFAGLPAVPQTPLLQPESTNHPPPPPDVR